MCFEKIKFIFLFYIEIKKKTKQNKSNFTNPLPNWKQILSSLLNKRKKKFNNYPVYINEIKLLYKNKKKKQQ